MNVLSIVDLSLIQAVVRAPIKYWREGMIGLNLQICTSVSFINVNVRADRRPLRVRTAVP